MKSVELEFYVTPFLPNVLSIESVEGKVVVGAWKNLTCTK